ncbi:MAG: hypothetical protein K6G65_08760 [Lachnospiraceae bacterium]|nr:hypothetical protein [Lachnospiraceae bacterium]
MQERIRQLQERFLEFWNKYTARQKTIIIGVIVLIVVVIGLLSYFLSRPKYETTLASFEEVADASNLGTLLSAANITYEQSRDGKTIFVQDKDYTAGLNVMADNEIQSDNYDWDWALDNDMSTTETEKNQKAILASQTELKNAICKIEGIEDATVSINVPDNTYTILDAEQDTNVSIILTLSEDISKDAAESIAVLVSNAVGAKNTDNVVIMDSEQNLLFSSASREGLGAAVSDKEEYEERLTNQYKLTVQQMLIKYGFDDVEVGANIAFNFDTVQEMYTEYTPDEGKDQGVYSSSYSYESKGKNTTAAGIPGTTSNDEETDYVIDNGGSSDSSVKVNKADYLPNERVTKTDYEVGAVQPENSSISVVLTRFIQYDEEALERQGLLEGITFEDYIDQNSARVASEYDEEQVISLISQATGIATENISVSAWDQPVFNPKEVSPVDPKNILMIVLAVLIVAFLVFVIVRGTAPVEVTEMEPELSVEQLLATTKENQTPEDIDFSEKSETRKMVEKFVDENPEAVANLLRNWLQDDWG